MKLYFYTVKAQRIKDAKTGLFEGEEYYLSCEEVEARETPKTYLHAEQSGGFPCCLTRLPKDRVDSGKVEEGFVILTKPDEESARAVWRQHYERKARIYMQNAEDSRSAAEHVRKIAQSL